MTAAQIPTAIMQAAGTYGVPASFALAVAQAESADNPNAISSAGAEGIFQLMPATAAQLGVTNPFDPQQNITAGVKYLGQLLAQYGDPYEALAAYNWGMGNLNPVLAAAAQSGSDWFSMIPGATQSYIIQIMGAPPPSSVTAPAIGLAPVGTSDDPTDDSSDTLFGVDLGTALTWLAIGGGALLAIGALEGN